ncbi:Drug/Metabolite Transporter (DMT) Superfamily [Thraustotheca clavata]|uniref:Drug/Metabolite Transporter (DMT) Superfamily n=1 Tax=Thraustotheca clavata TaxID=74557 RepID=A0A1W0A0L1_9STRA|nr:Drug/Metabolite Transporter (DMT) Superfamily [Thraustotheca clavata]
MSSISHLAVCVSGIYVCYLSYGIFQEKIFKYRDADGNKFTATLFLLCVQCIMNSLVAYAATFIWKPVNKAVPLQPFAFSAFAYLGAMLCSNEALKHVSYPTQALGKSCKMIPVMLMGVLIGRKKYALKEYISVFLITVGIVVFQLGKAASPSKQAQENSYYGLGLLFLSLTLDGITGPNQEFLSATYKPSVHQQMLNTNLWAVVYTAIGCIVTGQGIVGLNFCLGNPEIYSALFFFSVCSALGQNFIYFTIQRFSALTCTTITTTRKFFTILASVLVFGNALSYESWLGVAIVFTGPPRVVMKLLVTVKGVLENISVWNMTSLKEGYLTKRSASSKLITNWRKRYFRLEDKQLVYFEKKEDTEPSRSTPLGPESVLSRTNDKGYKLCFMIKATPTSENFYVQASTEEELKEWVDAITQVVGKVVDEGKDENEDGPKEAQGKPTEVEVVETPAAETKESE